MLEGKVALITGAGRGIGRAQALLFAKLGARVVVNDLGGSWDGGGADAGPAAEVADEIRQLGGHAIANAGSVADPDAAAGMVEAALTAYGQLDILVNNAGILRDRMVFNLDAADVRSVLDVHVLGHLNTLKAASAYWRTRAKERGPVGARVINTSSASGLFGNIGQVSYGAAKAAIAAITQIAAMELDRYGVTVNAICPTARTRLTLLGSNHIGDEQPRDDRWDPLDPANIAPFTAFLASDLSAAIQGQVFSVFGGQVQRLDGWHAGPRLTAPSGAFDVDDIARRWRELFPDEHTKFESPMADLRADIAAALAEAGFDSGEMA
jgi:NAD(P)-dependent dehydrogenase (short-subunit alcohol dehydrogenase family)